MDKDFLGPDKVKHIHFIGIGGISMSGLAEILISFGHKVSGSDIRPSNITQKLERKGAVIYYNHSEKNVNNPDAVVYTAAIKDNNPELIKARSLNIPIIDRATLLGLLMRKYLYSVAVAGTHGKTTTTSMIAMIMLESGLDPTVHIGGELDYIGGTTRIGGNNYFVTEADEYYESFLKFYPHIGVILNIEFDHPDYYKGIEHIKNSFLKFAQLVPKDGYVVACADDANISSLLCKIPANKITYGIINERPDTYIWSAGNIRIDESSGCASFTLLKNGREVDTIKLSVPGIHNIYNSLAAIAVCQSLGCSIPGIKQALFKFTGTHRRFELKGIFNNIKVIDDYAHHPSEIRATLKAAKCTNNSKIWCIFQPHTYSRTKTLLDDFSVAFSDADTVIVSDIYAARESDNGEINSKTLVEKINKAGGRAIYISDFDTIANYLKTNALPGDLIITMGAGDIYKVGEILLKEPYTKAVV
ncbi:MAG: UDP-N-acetylmuramate--L-alanine ligase [Firmicutes bacterium]|nr:UDP-N-acetylmuramate--L-alanine ligase [Bacillota bacterium]